MKVLKFGGTSVGSAKNIHKVISILDNLSKDSNLVVVVSAVGGVTDKLLNAAQLAIDKQSTYKDAFSKIKQQHLEIIEDLIEVCATRGDLRPETEMIC